MSVSAADRRIRALRPPKRAVDPYRAHGWLLEEERRPDGRRERALTVFLAGAECPFTCSFCDLWRYTIDGPTPAGAIPRQLEDTLLAVKDVSLDRVKLYNLTMEERVRIANRVKATDEAWDNLNIVKDGIFDAIQRGGIPSASPHP